MYNTVDLPTLFSRGKNNIVSSEKNLPRFSDNLAIFGAKMLMSISGSFPFMSPGEKRFVQS